MEIRGSRRRFHRAAGKSTHRARQHYWAIHLPASHPEHNWKHDGRQSARTSKPHRHPDREILATTAEELNILTAGRNPRQWRTPDFELTRWGRYSAVFVGCMSSGTSWMVDGSGNADRLRDHTQQVPRHKQDSAGTSLPAPKILTTGCGAICRLQLRQELPAWQWRLVFSCLPSAPDFA